MSYDPSIVLNTPWGTTKYPVKVADHFKRNIHTLRLLDRYTQLYHEVTEREVWDRNTMYAINSFKRSLASWLRTAHNDMNGILAEVRRLHGYYQPAPTARAMVLEGIVTWAGPLIMQAENVIASVKDYQRTVIYVDCEWKRAGRYWEKAINVKITTEPHADVLDIRRRPGKETPVRLKTDGDNIHLGTLAINGDILTLHERGRRGTVYYAK